MKCFDSLTLCNFRSYKCTYFKSTCMMQHHWCYSNWTIIPIDFKKVFVNLDPFVCNSLINLNLSSKFILIWACIWGCKLYAMNDRSNLYKCCIQIWIVSMKFHLNCLKFSYTFLIDLEFFNLKRFLKIGCTHSKTLPDLIIAMISILNINHIFKKLFLRWPFEN